MMRQNIYGMSHNKQLKHYSLQYAHKKIVPPLYFHLFQWIMIDDYTRLVALLQGTPMAEEIAMTPDDIYNFLKSIFKESIVKINVELWKILVDFQVKDGYLRIDNDKYLLGKESIDKLRSAPLVSVS